MRYVGLLVAIAALAGILTTAAIGRVHRHPHHDQAPWAP